jgi:hypothetical protein
LTLATIRISKINFIIIIIAATEIVISAINFTKIVIIIAISRYFVILSSCNYFSLVIVNFKGAIIEFRDYTVDGIIINLKHFRHFIRAITTRIFNFVIIIMIIANFS